jgi:ribosomal protein S18 acetylase RimI-like enzyme
LLEVAAMASDGLRIVDVTPEDVGRLPCCGIMDTRHEGHRSKTAWLKQHFALGLRARLLLDETGHEVGYIEYLPGEHAWRGVDAAGYLFIHCIWVHYKRYQRQGCAARLVAACVKEAKAAGLRGVAVLARKKPWLASSDLYVKCGFEVVATAPPDYVLLARKFRKRDPDPAFPAADEGRRKWNRPGLTIVYARQCPYAVKFARAIEQAAERDFGLKPRRVVLRTCRDARHAPTPYSVFSIILDGKIVADHQVSATRFTNIMKQQSRNRTAAQLGN